MPLLILRAATERPEGLEENALLSGYRLASIRRFLADPEAFRRPPLNHDIRPSENIVRYCRKWLSRTYI